LATAACGGDDGDDGGGDLEVAMVATWRSWEVAWRWR
jgi:hypothetical protein